MSESGAGSPAERRIDLLVVALVALVSLPCARAFHPASTLYTRDLHLIFWG